MISDVSLSHRSEKRIDDGMPEHVPVRMPGGPFGMRDPHASQNERTPSPEGMYIITDTDSHENLFK